MFTGIVTETGEVTSVSRKGNTARLNIKCEKISGDVEMGDSVSVNGVCLTATGTDKAGVFFDVVGNTLNKTGLKKIKRGDRVNLEGALRQGDKISGHMVTGHIDGERVIRSKTKTADGWVIDIGTIGGDEKYLISRGSVALDGISLTVAEASARHFRVCIIPHTFENTILKLKKSGDYVNVEFDMAAKYAEKQSSGKVTEDLLRRTGFM